MESLHIEQTSNIKRDQSAKMETGLYIHMFSFLKPKTKILLQSKRYAERELDKPAYIIYILLHLFSWEDENSKQIARLGKKEDAEMDSYDKSFKIPWYKLKTYACIFKLHSDYHLARKVSSQNVTSVYL